MVVSFIGRSKAGWLIKPDYEVMQFPGGEWFIKDHNKIELTEEYLFIQAPTADDLVIAGLWADMEGAEFRTILLPYLPGARGDHDMPSASWVYSAILNNFGLPVRYVDPHSTVMPNYLDRGQEIPIHRLIQNTVTDYNGVAPYMGVIAPDKGAVVRAGLVARRLEIPVDYATKERESATGKLSHFNAPTLPAGRYLVVDDICDGGGTFMGLATAIHAHNRDVRLDLWVTHGVFSGKAKEMLPTMYDTIYTTDSFPQEPTPGFKVVQILPTLIGG